MLKFVVSVFVVFAFLPSVAAVPIHLNFTFQCDIPSARHWCAELLVWEADSLTYDALEYTWQCTSLRMMKFELSISPEGVPSDGIYDLNWKIYTDCTSKYTSKRNIRCKCYPTDGYTKIPFEGEHVINKHYLFTHDDGKKMSDKVCKFPQAFKKDGRKLAGNTIIDSPCDQAFNLIKPEPSVLPHILGRNISYFQSKVFNKN